MSEGERKLLIPACVGLLSTCLEHSGWAKLKPGTWDSVCLAHQWQRPNYLSRLLQPGSWIGIRGARTRTRSSCKQLLSPVCQAPNLLWRVCSQPLWFILQGELRLSQTFSKILIPVGQLQGSLLTWVCTNSGEESIIINVASFHLHFPSTHH